MREPSIPSKGTLEKQDHGVDMSKRAKGLKLLEKDDEDNVSFLIRVREGTEETIDFAGKERQLIYRPPTMGERLKAAEILNKMYDARSPKMTAEKTTEESEGANRLIINKHVVRMG